MQRAVDSDGGSATGAGFDFGKLSILGTAVGSISANIGPTGRNIAHVPPCAGQPPIRLTATPRSAAPVAWSIDPASTAGIASGTVLTPARDTLSATLALGAAQKGGFLDIKAENSDGGDLMQYRLASHPTTIASTTAVSDPIDTRLYGGVFNHVFTSHDGQVASLDEVGVGERFPNVPTPNAPTHTFQTPFGLATLRTGTLPDRPSDATGNWFLTSSGELGGNADTVSTPKNSIDIGRHLASDSNPSPANPMPVQFVVDQQFFWWCPHAPLGRRWSHVADTTQTHLLRRTKVGTGAEFVAIVNSKENAMPYEGVTGVTNARASPATVTPSSAGAANTVQIQADAFPDTRPLFFSIRGNPRGCTIDKATGELTIGAQTGTVKVRAANQLNGSNWDEVDVAIAAPGAPAPSPSPTAPGAQPAPAPTPHGGGGRPELQRSLAGTAAAVAGSGTGLVVNRPGDRYEQEADRVAEQIVRSLAVSDEAPPAAARLGGVDPAHPVQTPAGTTAWLQRQPVDSPGEIEMPAEDFSQIPVVPTTIKSRRADTDWIKDPAAGGSMDESQWAATDRADVKKRYSDAARVAQAGKVFVGPAAVANAADNVNIIKDSANARHYLPGLNYSAFVIDRGLTGYVAATGGELINKLTPSRTAPLPKVALVLSAQALSSKSTALGVLRHEMVHVEHLTLALKTAQKWIDSKSTSSFEDWLNEEHDKSRITSLDLELSKDAANAKSANTELLAYAEGFMTAFLLAPPPADNDDAAFFELYGMFSSTAEPWAYANVPVRQEALGRLQEYYCHVLDQPHRESFDRFVLRRRTQQTTKAPGWTWAPKRQMHDHFFAGLKTIIDAKCKPVGGPTRATPPPAKGKGR